MKDSFYHSVTIPLVPVNEGIWQDYLDILIKMRADRVLLFSPLDNICRTYKEVRKNVTGDIRLKPLPAQETADTPSLELFEEWSGILADRIDYFLMHGIETAYWIGHTIGHGGSLSAGDLPAFQQIVGPEGIEADGCYCPLDTAFSTYICNALSIMARTKVSLILLDDDYRLHSHKPAASIGCFCPLHLEAFYQKTGFRLGREEIIQQAFQGRPNSIRKAWMDVLGESLLGFARQIEQAVHTVSPKTRIGLATAMTLWSNEGIEMEDLLKAFSGQTKPFLRTVGAPYWAKEPSQVSWVIEFTRLQESWAHQWGIEMAAEGDTFPHTRYHCSAAMLHAYQTGLHASGYPGFISYPVTYSPAPQHEMGYVKMNEESFGYYAALREFFPVNYEDAGVTAYHKPNNFMHMTLPDDASKSTITWPDEPLAIRYLARLGIPLAYRNGNGPVLLSGYGAAGLEDEELQRLLNRGAILDSVSAAWLLERGIDIGIISASKGKVPKFEHFFDAEFSGSYTGDSIWLLTPGEDIYSRFEIRSNARIISSFEGNGEVEHYPAVFLYENRQGQRFCVLAIDFFNAKGGMQLVYNYARQEQLTRCLAWVNRRPLPVTLNGYPDVHVICRQSPDGHRIVVAVQNTHLDAIRQPILKLGPQIFVGNEIELLLPDASEATITSEFEYSHDGIFGHLKLSCTIPPMGMLSIGLTGV